ncbi:helix-turn-helix domain-containing protein [Paenibacillus agaridevorans]|uniref:helix-turn-helix domain-containing protein n=1 Tax=Paenibacillus agaridevorans TaxID=171404 RepID=UPI001BE44CC6|nr:helix-turn-helix transcriptional regulator [Paenibacillus agaridevorans]
MLEWALRQVMADRGIWTGVALARLLKLKANYSLSGASISGLLNSEPRQMKSETMDALCTALECTPNDLWVHTSPQKVQGG